MMATYIQWNLSITDTLGPDIFWHFLLQYKGFPLSEVKNVLVTPVGTKIFILIMEVFSIVSLIQRVWFHCNYSHAPYIYTYRYTKG